MLFVYILLIVGIIISLCGLFEILSPKLQTFIDIATIKKIDTVLYKLCLLSGYVLIAVIVFFVIGGVVITISG